MTKSIKIILTIVFLLFIAWFLPVIPIKERVYENCGIIYNSGCDIPKYAWHFKSGYRLYVQSNIALDPS